MYVDKNKSKIVIANTEIIILQKCLKTINNIQFNKLINITNIELSSLLTILQLFKKIIEE